jgi:hypothetical protein
MTTKIDYGDIPRKTKQVSELGQSHRPKIDYGNVSYNAPPQGMELLKNIGDVLGGGAVGLAQGGSDIGANIAQFPSDIYSYFSGKQGYTAPKPSFREYGPQSELGQKSEEAGEFAAPFVGSPALAAETMLGKTMFGGRMLPRLVTDALLGSAESENRKLGAAGGLAAPIAGKAIKLVKETPLTKYGATKNLAKARELAGEESLGIPLSIDFLRNLEYQMGSSHLKPNKMQINNLLGEAAKGDYPSYFNLQSALGDISRELMYPDTQKGKGLMGMIASLFNKPQTTAAERLTGKQLDELKKQYITQAMEHLNETGKSKIAQLETKGKQDYSNYMNFRPWRNRALFGAVAGIPGMEYLKHLFHD